MQSQPPSEEEEGTVLSGAQTATVRTKLAGELTGTFCSGKELGSN